MFSRGHSPGYRTSGMACGWFGEESLAQPRRLLRRIFGQVAENNSRGEAAGAIAQGVTQRRVASIIRPDETILRAFASITLATIEKISSN
jgi:hypothetical protein